MGCRRHPFDCGELWGTHEGAAWQLSAQRCTLSASGLGILDRRQASGFPGVFRFYGKIFRPQPMMLPEGDDRTFGRIISHARFGCSGRSTCSPTGLATMSAS